jgi:hypothetical protein
MVTFKQLWSNHPSITGEKNPCTTKGKKNFDNQCAIRVGVSLVKCGVKTTEIPGVVHCWHGHDKSQGHVIRAEELANGLVRYPIQGIRKMVKITPQNFSKQLSGKTGIIFFKDYWRRTNKDVTESHRNRSGDHIDFWNGSRITNTSSWARIHLRFGNFGLHSISDEWSDYEDSKQIWFWAVT